MKRALPIIVALFAACASPGAGGDDLLAPEAVVRELYELISVEPGSATDWDAVRVLFEEGAVVVLRTGRDEMSVLDLEAFIGDFVAFIERARVQETGFRERVLDTWGFAYGDTAQVVVRFDSYIPGSERGPQEGIDVFALVQRGGRWRIASIVNERPLEGVPDPDVLMRSLGGAPR